MCIVPCERNKNIFLKFTENMYIYEFDHKMESLLKLIRNIIQIN